MTTELTMQAPAKPIKKKHFCKSCNIELKQQVHRPWYIKKFLFFLPLRKYVCTKCLGEYYVSVPASK